MKLKSQPPNGGNIRPLILSLGHPLHELPFESMPMLRGHPVSRIPSLPFLVAQLFSQQSRCTTDPKADQGFYIINPSGDSKNTKKLEDLVMQLGWEGKIGTPPTSEQFVYGLENKRIFMYVTVLPCCACFMVLLFLCCKLLWSRNGKKILPDQRNG